MLGLAGAALLGPVVVHDSRETSPLGSVGERPARSPRFRSSTSARPATGASGGWPSRVIYVAAGSHAAYFRPGVRDRTWPDPNDEADGRGAVAAPPVEPLGDWVRWPGRWGASRAGFVPGEMDSPRGPAFQPQGRWSDPDAWAAAARPCTLDRCDEAGECDTRESLIAFAAPVLAGLAVLALLRRRSSTDAEHPEP